MKKILHIAMACAAVSMILLACQRKEATTWNPEYAAPLVHGRLGLDDLVTDSLLLADQQGLWYLHFMSDVANYALDSLVRLPDTTIHVGFDVPLNGGPFLLPPGQVIIQQDDQRALQVNGAQLKEVKLKSGYLKYRVSSYVDGYLDCSYLLPGVTQNGVPLNITATTLPAPGNSPSEQSGQIDLSGYHFDLTGINGNLYNRFETQTIVRIAPNAPQSASVNGDDSVVVELQFVRPVIDYARGYFSNSTNVISESVDLTEAIGVPEGALDLTSSTLHLHILNTLGVDATLNFGQLTGTGASTTTLQFPPFQHPIHITRATDQSGQVIATAQDFELNDGNSNLTNFLENLPTALNWNGTLVLNPLGNVSESNDFYYANYPFSARMDLAIPLRLAMQNLGLRDTFELTNDALEWDASGQLDLVVWNRFPFSATAEVVLLREGYSPVVLIDQATLAAGWYDDATFQSAAVESTIPIQLPEGVLQTFGAPGKLAVRFNLNTPNWNQPVSIRNDQYIDFKVIGHGTVLLSND
jgi:hypothetical protein